MTDEITRMQTGTITVQEQDGTLREDGFYLRLEPNGDILCEIEVNGEYTCIGTFEAMNLPAGTTSITLMIKEEHGR